MKTGKKAAIFALLIGTLGMHPQADAIDVTAILVALPVATGEYALVATLYPTALTEGVDDNAVYYQTLRDDAVQEVADDGAPSAVLEDAIQQIRAQTGTTLDDRRLAIQILKALDTPAN